MLDLPLIKCDSMLNAIESHNRWYNEELIKEIYGKGDPRIDTDLCLYIHKQNRSIVFSSKPKSDVWEKLSTEEIILISKITLSYCKSKAEFESFFTLSDHLVSVAGTEKKDEFLKESGRLTSRARFKIRQMSDEGGAITFKKRLDVLKESIEELRDLSLKTSAQPEFQNFLNGKIEKFQQRLSKVSTDHKIQTAKKYHWEVGRIEGKLDKNQSKINECIQAVMSYPETSLDELIQRDAQKNLLKEKKKLKQEIEDLMLANAPKQGEIDNIYTQGLSLDYLEEFIQKRNDLVIALKNILIDCDEDEKALDVVRQQYASVMSKFHQGKQIEDLKASLDKQINETKRRGQVELVVGVYGKLGKSPLFEKLDERHRSLLGLKEELNQEDCNIVSIEERVKQCSSSSEELGQQYNKFLKLLLNAKENNFQEFSESYDSLLNEV